MWCVWYISATREHTKALGSSEQACSLPYLVYLPTLSLICINKIGKWRCYLNSDHDPCAHYIDNQVGKKCFANFLKSPKFLSLFV